MQLQQLNANVTANPILKPSKESLGKGYRVLALQFQKMYPIGSVLTNDQFDEFAILFGDVPPPTNTEKGSEGWLAFMQRRHQFKSNLNKGAAHQEMELRGGKAFYVRRSGNNLMEVCSTYEVATATGEYAVMRQMETLVKTKQRLLRQLINSVDYSVLPVGEQVKVMMLADHITDFETRIKREISDLDTKFYSVRSGIQHLLTDGQVVPKNGGIKALVNSQDSLPEMDTCTKAEMIRSASLAALDY